MSKEHLLDVRGLEPPGPMERLLEALAELPRGERLKLLIHREPFPAYQMLEANGFRFTTAALPDGSFEILIWQEP